MENIIVIGGGGHAKVVISILKKIDRFNILGYSELEDYGPLLNINYLGNDDLVIDNYADKSMSVVLGVGQIKSPELRKHLVKKYINAGFNFPAIISSHAIVNEAVTVGNGTVVMDNVVINTGSIIGNHSILNTSSTIEHNCSIGDYVHIAPGSTLSGEVTVGNSTFIGAGSTIANSVSISKDCIIGAGSLVRKNISQSGLYVGNPIKKYK